MPTRTAPRTSTGPARTLAGIVLALGIAAAVAGAAVVGVALAQPGGAVRVLVDAGALALEDVPGLPSGALELAAEGGAAVSSGTPSAPLTLEVRELPAGLRLLTELPVLALGLLTLAGAAVLRRILLAVAGGHPFDARNPDRLRGLALLTLVGAFLPSALASLATVVVLEHLDAAGPSSPLGFSILELSLTPLLVAATLCVVAAVFQHGQRLTADVEGLV